MTQKKGISHICLFQVLSMLLYLHKAEPLWSNLKVMFRHTLSAEVPQTNIKVESWEMSKIILIEKIIGVLNDFA